MRRLLRVLMAVTVAAPLLATEPNPSAQQRKLVEALLSAMNFDATLRGVTDTMYAQLEKQFIDAAKQKGSDPDAIAEAEEMFAAFRSHAASIDLGGEMRESYIRIYAKYFSDQDLKDITAFYASPAGKRAVELMPKLMQEGMQAGMQTLSPKIEQAMKDAADDVERKRPWRRTMSDIRTVAAAVEAYAVDHDETYPGGDYAALASVLVPNYLKTLPAKDMWNHEYAYSVSEDRKHYRIVSAGADTIFEWDSRRVVAKDESSEPQVRYRDRLEDDLIYQDGAFIQLPVQAKPKQK